MEVSIRIEEGRCHECGHEYVIMSRKVEHPKELKVPAAARCPECGSDTPVTFGSPRQFVSITIDNLGQLSEIMLQDTKCVKCGTALTLLSGERTDMIFKMEKVLNESEGLVEEWTRHVPFCKHCKEQETEESLINACQKYFEAEKENSPAEQSAKTINWKD